MLSNPKPAAERKIVTITRSKLSNKWYAFEEEVNYPVYVALGGYTWAVETPTFKVVFDNNFAPYTVNVVDHEIVEITDPFGNQLDEYHFVVGSNQIEHFFKMRSVDGEIERVNIGKRFDAQKYGSEKGRESAQIRYTLGW